MRTESNIRPSSRLEIEALPRKEGAACTVILYDNIQGPFTKPAESEGGEGETFYTYDRYEVEAVYRENLEESVGERFDEWLQKGKDAEAAGTPKTDIEVLQDQVKELQKENQQLKDANAEMNDIIDELIIASLENLSLGGGVRV